MDVEVYTPNEVQRLISFWEDYMRLKNYQVKRIYKLMDKYTGIWQQIFISAKQQLEKVIFQLPTNEDLIKIAQEQQWINFQDNPNNILVSVNEDLYTYLVYNSLEQKKNQNIYTDLQKFNEIGIQNIVFEAVKAACPNLCEMIENGMEENKPVQLEIKEIIYKLMTSNDVLDQEIFNMMQQEIRFKCHKTIQDQIKNMKDYILNILQVYQPTANAIVQHNFRQNIFRFSEFAINPPHIPEELYKNIHIKPLIDLKQIPTEQGLFLLTIEENKTLIFLERSQKQAAYIVNPFSKDSELIERIKEQFKTYMIRMVNLQYKSTAQRYFIIQWMIKYEMEYRSNTSQFYEFYSNRHVEFCEYQCSERLKQINVQQQQISQFTQQIDSKFTRYKDMLLPEFLEALLQRKPNLNQNILVNVAIIDQNQMLQSSDDSLGAIIVKDNKFLIGFRLKGENSYAFYLVNQIPNFTCIITKVRQIDPKVAQFYLSLIMSNKGHISKNIMRFLELKPSGLDFVYNLIK